MAGLPPLRSLHPHRHHPGRPPTDIFRRPGLRPDDDPQDLLRGGRQFVLALLALLIDAQVPDRLLEQRLLEDRELFLSAKAYTGCLLLDISSLKSAQLRVGRLVFPADVTKSRMERAVPMPQDLFDALAAFRGLTWLWEGYLPGVKEALQRLGWPTHQIVAELSPMRLNYWWETLFAEYNKSRPGQPTLTTHVLRKRAFRMAWEAGVDPRRASIAYGCNVDTLMRHYVGLDEQEVTDGVFAQVNGR